MKSFLESRLGLPSFLHKSLSGKRPPRGTSWLHTFGFAALLVFVMMLLTGLALSFHYVPSADHAYDSIRVLEQDSWGRFARALHHWGASAMIILLVLHVLRTLLHGAYKRPREFTWLLGLVLLACVLGLGFTGYLLPWDQKAYFATKVGVNIAALTPGAGEHIERILYGGAELGPNTLSRFYVLHILVLPGLLIAALVLHLWQIQRHGISPVGCRVEDPGVPGEPYHPSHTFREAVVGVLVLGALALLAWQHSAPLEAVASAADRSYEPRPDWYFLGVFEFLKLFPGEHEVIGAFWIPAGLGLLLVLLPFVDRNPERRLRRRPIVLTLTLAFSVGLGVLTVRGFLDAPGHFATPQHPLGTSPEIRLGYDLTRSEGCFQCHSYTDADGRVFGKMHELLPSDFADLNFDAEYLADYLANAESDVMPSSPHLSHAERLAMARYLLLLSERPEQPQQR
jgi:ubiquinol-cytochrome c reductase cytochrome b subunit